ncbi:MULTISPECIES: hypothetical protein [Brucella]|uniref:hypothetical protein n=1 Tax=Brucella/Ochrobactrum group TaxID=2826938 RepID=UPI00159CB900|nr:MULTISPECIES: hypothetical protein [Brucella]MDX4076014.1 hypothetical protein [Brucella sp. NBRC 113783]NVM43119.1 hypothetical protein [Brucella intermedia]
MIRLIPGVLAVSVFCAPALSAEADDVVVKNDLSGCVTLTSAKFKPTRTLCQ